MFKRYLIHQVGFSMYLKAICRQNFISNRVFEPYFDNLTAEAYSKLL